MDPILSLIPDGGLRSVNDVGSDFLTPVRRQAVQEDRRRICKLHQLRADLIGLHGGNVLFSARLPHRDPCVGHDDLRAANRVLRIADHLDRASGFSCSGNELRVGIVAFGSA